MIICPRPGRVRPGGHPPRGPPSPIEHVVEVAPESRLAAVVGATTVSVKSWHHQAVRTAPPGWRVVAHAPDGVIEALEHQEHPWAIAVQWHPELSAGDPHHERVFRALVEAARARADK